MTMLKDAHALFAECLSVCILDCVPHLGLWYNIWVIVLHTDDGGTISVNDIRVKGYEYFLLLVEANPCTRPWWPEAMNTPFSICTMTYLFQSVDGPKVSEFLCLSWFLSGTWLCTWAHACLRQNWWMCPDSGPATPLEPNYATQNTPNSTFTIRGALCPNLNKCQTCGKYHTLPLRIDTYNLVPGIWVQKNSHQESCIYTTLISAPHKTESTAQIPWGTVMKEVFK